MIYNILKWIAGIALHWFYRDIRIVDGGRIPARGPLIIAVNHHNALVDSLIIAWVIPRRIAMTAKATLKDNPLIAFVFRLVNVVPLRRVSDELEKLKTGAVDRSRNQGAFSEILGLLATEGAVLIFPEGKSHNEPRVEPLKTGMARIALQARDEKGIRGVRILPIGLVFEDKGTPGSAATAHIGVPIEIDQWRGSDPVALTAEVGSQLKALAEHRTIVHPEIARAEHGRPVIREVLISIAAWWGRVTHRLPIRIARALAVSRSTDADQPAMLTIMFGIGLVLLTYAVHLTIVGIVSHSAVLVLLYLVGLVSGAYWAAFESRFRRAR
jgi:1-acyl-sn-glycerol-3-phosphate acyltransferase